MTLAKHSIKISYQGGSADDSELSLYDGATSIYGISQSLQIAIHSYLNREIVSRATALKGASLFVRPPKRGSFVLEIVALIEQYPATTNTLAAISAPVFYDFLKLAYGKATGLLNDPPTTPYVSRLLDRDEPFFDELGEVLEGSLHRAHRPIGESVDTILVSRPRLSLIEFNEETKDWVDAADVLPDEENLTGNITRFNSITRNGRAFIDQIGRIVPFKPDQNFPPGSIGSLTWSLHGSNMDLPKRLKIKARRVTSASGKTKRLIFYDVQRDQ